MRVVDYKEEPIVYPVEVLVQFACGACSASYELPVEDLLEIAEEGCVICECGCSIRVADQLGLLHTRN